MKTLKIIIEKSSDYYDAYAENCEGVYGAGITAEEAKQNVSEGLNLFVNSRKKEDLPDILKSEYNIVFSYDIRSFLNYFGKLFSFAALERITKINQKLLQHYASGLKKPGQTQIKKIEKAFHELAAELSAVEL
ncbi:MAG: type II toxin-antitoxin system HicB family antitoxin [Candidatus Azobacteroides sp.]|nr:type II toxin-antitoxin system HicB family antitoxin [Candidatus Azobacteroides sp.]